MNDVKRDSIPSANNLLHMESEWMISEIRVIEVCAYDD